MHKCIWYGVNKANTRYIIHFHYPTNIASYLQEIGRAGRDGEPSIAILLCSPLDHDLPISIIEDELPSKSQIKFLFSLLQERIFQTKELPIEDVEEICYNAARFNEAILAFRSLSSRTGWNYTTTKIIIRRFVR